jgi:hypothetical protein
LSSLCVWMVDLGVPPILICQYAMHGGLCDVVFRWLRFLGSVGSYHKIHHKFSHVVPSRVRFVV